MERKSEADFRQTCGVLRRSSETGWTELRDHSRTAEPPRQAAAAEAERVTKVGLAQAEAIEKQAAASGGARYQLTRQIAERFAEALEKSGVDIGPRIAVSGGGEGSASAPGGAMLQAIMAMVLSDKVLNVPYTFNIWIPLIGIVGGGAGVAIAGLLGTRKAVNSAPLATIRALT